MSPDRQTVADALAGALVLADLADAGQADAFALEVSRVAAWATEAGDEVALALVHEIEQVLTQTAAGDMTPVEAAALIGELLGAMLEAPDSATSSAPTLAIEQNPYASDAAVVGDFISGTREHLDEAEGLLSACATGGTADVDALFRCFHTLKGMAGFLSLDAMATLAHEAEASLDAVRSEKREMTEGELESGLKAVDAIREMVASLADVPATAEKSKAAQKRGAETVRVHAGRLEGLLDAMGELAVAEAELAAAVTRTGDHAALRSLERLNRIARDMQQTATALRMVSLKPTFTKMSRVVRDIVAKSGKRVEMTVSGGDTELDRAIVEAISDPLVHLLRNAVDHGIEPPAKRKAAGKPETGSLQLRAFHRSGSVYIEIEDDGRGIDVDALLAKATSMGIDIERERAMELIFRPGFSTAETITEISGRGVGMDAVSSTVAGLRGQLDVRSTLGVGSTFSIRLPLTLAVIDGIVLRAGSERYVVPTHFVERTASVTSDQVVSTAGQGEALILADGPIAVIKITEIMGGDVDSGEVAIILVDGEERFAILVDEVIGQQSLVIKPLTGPATKSAGAAGAALMGDGRVALVVDPAGIAKAMRGGW